MKEAPKNHVPIKSQGAKYWVQLVQLGVTILMLLVAVFGLQLPLKQIGIRVENVEKSLLSREFTITHPTDTSLVDFTELIQGKTPFSGKNHYIVITPLTTGDDWVMDTPATVSTGGSWTGRARFGSATAGAGEQFLVRALATKSTLSPGPLTKVPEDAVFSDSIVVTRKR